MTLGLTGALLCTGAGGAAAAAEPGLGAAVEGAVQSAGQVAGVVVAQATEPARPVTEAAAQATAPVTGAVEPVTRAVEPVARAVQPVTEAVRRTVEPVARVVEPVRRAVEPVTEAVRRTVEPVATSVEPVTGAAAPPARPERSEPARTDRRAGSAGGAAEDPPVAHAPTAPMVAADAPRADAERVAVLPPGPREAHAPASLPSGIPQLLAPRPHRRGDPSPPPATRRASADAPDLSNAAGTVAGVVASATGAAGIAAVALLLLVLVLSAPTLMRPLVEAVLRARPWPAPLPLERPG